MKRLITVQLLLCCAFLIHAQNDAPFKFGKPNQTEMDLDACEFDPSAKSMVLGETGKLNFIYTVENGWQYRLKVNRRIKVFDITDADRGNVKIKVYQPKKGSASEEISGIKGFTYNIENGKIIKEKTDRREILKSE